MRGTVLAASCRDNRRCQEPYLVLSRLAVASHGPRSCCRWGSRSRRWVPVGVSCMRPVQAQGPLVTAAFCHHRGARGDVAVVFRAQSCPLAPLGLWCCRNCAGASKG